ncbi:MAG: hypothetical protein G01um101433_763 [Parcubacteria group bacterium Gr01-1014_33]|nr:MAG: hypothetical protein G01um101433_763 [Parcubacteria group bacterium Gr01-1014_33]
MRIIFTDHAKKRMEERKISQDMVADCIMHPTRVIAEGEKIRHFQKSLNGIILAAVRNC